MATPASLILQDHIEAAESSIESLEIDALDLDDERAVAALKAGQEAYRRLVAELKKLVEGLGYA